MTFVAVVAVVVAPAVAVVAAIKFSAHIPPLPITNCTYLTCAMCCSHTRKKPSPFANDPSYNCPLLYPVRAPMLIVLRVNRCRVIASAWPRHKQRMPTRKPIRP